MSGNALPAVALSFPETFWTEHCVMVSNVERCAELPAGNGLELREDEPFHISLLTRRVWAQDNFWHLGMSFDKIPIEETDDGQFTLKPAVSDTWLQLQYCMVATYDVLRAKFLSLAPLRTRLPPYPQSTNFHGTHATELAARRAAHRTRRIFLAWQCLIACAIAASNRGEKVEPPAWFRALSDSEVPFPPFWLDRIGKSPILMNFTPDTPRRGMVVNMYEEWGFWSLLDVFHEACIPMWLCFPHGETIKYKLAKDLYPTSATLCTAKKKFTQGKVEVDNTDDVRDYRSIGHPLPQVDNTNRDRNRLDSNKVPREPSRSDREEDNTLPVGHKQVHTHHDALSEFFRRRKVQNDRRDLSMYSDKELDMMRAQGKVLQSTSQVYEWETIDVFPWFVRKKVAEWDQRRVWESYTANQRVYDEFDNEWDCFCDFAPIESVSCTIVGCRDTTHDHEDRHDDDEVEEGELPELGRPNPNHKSLATNEGEWLELSFTSAQMESFLDVLKYRYGIKIPNVVDAPQVALEPTPLLLLMALRAMVQEEVLKIPDWKSEPVVESILQFYTATKADTRVPVHLSDCHLEDDDFLRLHNVWGFSITTFTKNDSKTRLYGIQTVNTRMVGWMIAVDSRIAIREILRRGWGPANAQIARPLLERGMSVYMLSSSTPVPRPWCLPSLYETPYRREGYTFSVADYRAYIERRIELFKDKSIATAALRHGGIIWRLAMESNVDINAVVVAAAKDRAFTWQTVKAGNTVLEYHTLSDEVLDVIVGMYKVYTGKGEQTADISWWPKAIAWNVSGFNCGQWTFQCEEWFRRRRDLIVSGSASPRKRKEWQSALRLRMNATRALTKKMECEFTQDN
ncbi:hypothetical protein QCA50_012480 [Cerrena zonata]|uniref:Uncharacterized protein n=1 Tax=Cerrena zonata TaxID=2478898 RepID=A0AAW0FSA5_9APHY